MAQNKLIDLNNHLFEALERLNDDEHMEVNGDKEIARAKAVTGVAQQIISLGNLALDAQKHKDEWGTMPDILALAGGG
jgi:hypothetical protein